MKYSIVMRKRILFNFSKESLEWRPTMIAVIFAIEERNKCVFSAYSLQFTQCPWPDGGQQTNKKRGKRKKKREKIALIRSNCPIINVDK